jgi:hypothetical protein
MKKILIEFHDNDAYDLKNQYFFIAQSLMAMILFNMQAYDSCERILYYVLQNQIEYVEHDKEHPFLE